MASALRMPRESELPDSPLRDFVELLFVFYREARRPTLRQISRAIQDADSTGTASTETIRRMLRGTTVPSRWETVSAVLDGLCYLADPDWDPEDPDWDYLGVPGSPRYHLLRRWHKAIDEHGMVYVRQPTFSDDPPF
jgi:hypothetical protein